MLLVQHRTMLSRPASQVLGSSCTPAVRDVVAAARKPKQQKPQRRKQRAPRGPVTERILVDPDLDDFEDAPTDVMLVPAGRAPAAPPTGSKIAELASRPEDLYPVFPSQPSVVSKLPSSSKWSWDDDRSAGQHPEQDVPMWNPKTGFMRTRMQVEQQQKQQEQPLAAAGSSTSSSPPQPIPKLQSSSSSSSSSGDGDGLSSASSWVTPLGSVSVPNVSAIDSLQEASSSSAPGSPQPPPAAAATTGRGALPDVSREQVLGSCLSVSAVMATAAAALHVFAQQEAAQLLGTEQAVLDQLLRLPAGFDNLQQAAYVPAAAGCVTAARMVLMQQWPDFAEATNRSNQQVLSPLGWTDVALIATFTGVTEELLFRGSLIPATLPDYRGVLLSGLLFGVLHVSGGRNIAFAVWATAVGWLYGAVFLATSNVWVAAGAHSLANFASAAIWKKNTAGHHRL